MPCNLIVIADLTKLLETFYYIYIEYITLSIGERALVFEKQQNRK